MAKVIELTECEDCGQCFAEGPHDRGICPECEEQFRLQNEENEREELLNKALDCRCGAYGIGPSSRAYHAADCVCGRT